MHQLTPTRGRVDVDFDDARVRRDGQTHQADIVWWLVALDYHRLLQGCSGGFDRRHQVKVVFECAQRWQEDVQTPLANLDADGGVRHPERISRPIGWRPSYFC